MSKKYYSELIRAVQYLRTAGIIRRDSEIGEMLGYSKGVVSNYLSGRIGPSAKFMNALYEKYPEALKTKNSENETKFRNDTKQVGDYGSANYYMAKSGNVFLDMPGGDVMFLLTPVVTVKSQLGYMRGWGDPEYIDTLPQHPIVVDKRHQGKYLTFEGEGDSMDNGASDAIEDGDYITGRLVPYTHWRENKLHYSRKDKPDFIFHTRDGITTKRVVEHNVEEGWILCTCLNPNKDLYPDFKINVEDISEIYYVVQITKRR